MFVRIISRNLALNTQLQKCYNPLRSQRRNLKLLEHISFEILSAAAIPVPKFSVATTPEQAKVATASFKSKCVVLKAQVLTGGRGKGKFKNSSIGGVKMVSTPEEAEQVAKLMLNQVLVTKQTGEKGKICKKVMIVQRKFPRREFYIAIALAVPYSGPVIIASKEGGVDIEVIAATNPKAIIYEPIDIMKGITHEQTSKIAKNIGLGPQADYVAQIMDRMYALFIQTDALLIEINPFIEDCMEAADKKNIFFALDCKMEFDKSAAFRQKELFALQDWSQKDSKEVAAAKHNLHYISLDGNIGCMVNGAGLAMATMDMCHFYGGRPANFLDLGGAATKETVTEAFKIVTTDPNVKVIFVNIFAGIMRCDVIAGGIIEAVKQLKLHIPIITRLKGTNSKEAKKLIKESKLNIFHRGNFDEAARLAVQLLLILKTAKEAHVNVTITTKPKKQKLKTTADPVDNICHSEHLIRERM